MNQPSEQEYWSDRLARRPLTPAETARFHAWLETHPAAREALDEEACLTRLLHRQPPAPVPTNFTARVLEEIGRSGTPRARVSRTGWRRWLGPLRPAWQLAAALSALALVVAVQHHYRTQARLELARTLSDLPLEALADPGLWRDFDQIQVLPSGPLPSVDELAAALK